MPFDSGKSYGRSSTSLQGSMLRKPGAEHRMGRGQAIEGRTPDAQTVPPRRNVNLKSKASVK